MAQLHPEQRARERIDDLLAKAGWQVQDAAALNLYAGRGIAVREFSTQAGPADYLLYVDRRAAGVIEAKREGFPLIGVEPQSDKYSAGAKVNLLTYPGLTASFGASTHQPVTHRSTTSSGFLDLDALAKQEKAHLSVICRRGADSRLDAAKAEAIQGRSSCSTRASLHDTEYRETGIHPKQVWQ